MIVNTKKPLFKANFRTTWLLVLTSLILIMVHCIKDDLISPDSGLTDEESLRLASNNLAIGYSGEDTSNNVTTHLTLTNLASNGVSISWSSSTNFIGTNGIVMPPTFAQGEQTVTLTARLSKNALTHTKIFTLIVMAQPPTDREAVRLASNHLAIGYATGETNTNVTSDVLLTNMGSHGVSIFWSSDMSNIITTSGAVTRPAFIQGNKTVRLTARLSKNALTNEKSFILTVIKQYRLNTRELSSHRHH